MSIESKKRKSTAVPPAPPENCTCYGRGQCAACAVAYYERHGRLPDNEIIRSLRACGVARS